ncbi:hypothetical protein AB0M28_13340 [Streptomyces sp. NPDC051940]|uniref:hypothetical protein n=1 Tax=Streptomyces sp. NPDC051940 TaxID=3155675 RepID=UPI00342C4421
MCHEIEGLSVRALLASPQRRPPSEPRRISRECMVNAHDLCPGWAGKVWPEGGAYASKPLVTVDCGCPTPECDCVEERKRREAAR